MTVDFRPAAIAGSIAPIRTQGSWSADGLALLADGRFQEAIAPLRLALARGDVRPSMVLNLAIAEDHAGSRDHARRLMHHVADRLPNWDEPVVRLAESLRAAGETAAAEAAYRRALDLNPTRTHALIALSGLLLIRNESEEARDLLVRCCEIEPENAEAWHTLGLALRMSGKPGLALSAFVRAQGLLPDRLSYVLNGVNVAEAAKEADAELARLTVTCDQNPLNIVLQVGRGVLLERMGHRREAIDALEAAAELAPGELEPLRLLGGALARSNRIPRAEAVLRRVIALDPDDLQMGNNLAVVLTRLQRHREAEAVLHDLLDRHGPNHAVLCNLANVNIALGLQDKAVEFAQKAIQLDPGAMMPRLTMCNTLPYHEGTTATSLISAMRDCSLALPRVPQPRFANLADPDRPLVVGLLSGSLETHPVGLSTQRQNVPCFRNATMSPFE
jgi:protein O-GlcNAc transferase